MAVREVAREEMTVSAPMVSLPTASTHRRMVTASPRLRAPSAARAWRVVPAPMEQSPWTMTSRRKSQLLPQEKVPSVTRISFSTRPLGYWTEGATKIRSCP